MAVLHNSDLDSLLNKARGEEKRYEWLQAAEFYQKASNLVLKDNDLSNAAALTGRIGFSFYRAAFQAQTNTEFKNRLGFAIQAYEKEIKILEKSNEENKHAKIKQAKALATYVRSWLETGVPQKKELLDEWWALENQVLEACESSGDVHSVGVVCTDMIEFSLYARLWLSNHSEEVRLEEEALRLADKAIEALSKSEDDYELARAYCFASVWYSSQSHASPEFRDKHPQLAERGRDFSKKAMELSSKTHDAWLIGFAYYSASTAAIWYDWNFTKAAEHGQKTQEYGSIAKDQLLLTYGTYNTACPMTVIGEFLEDPDKQRITFEKARKLAQECVQVSRIINHMTNVCWGYFYELSALTWLAAIETDQRIRQKTLENAIKIAREGLEVTAGWKRLSANLHMSLGDSLRLLSAIRNDVEEKRALLLEAQIHQEKAIAIHEEFVPFLYSMLSWTQYNLGLVQNELAMIETDEAGKAELLERAAKTLENSKGLLARWIILHPENVQMTQVWGRHCDRLGRVLQQIYYLTKEEKQLSRAIEAHRESATAFNRGELPAHAAESYWIIAQLQSQIGKHQEASKDYEAASQSYDLSAKKIPQLPAFYKNYSTYMLAWSQIEQAKYNHLIGEYEEAEQNYEKAAKLHESTEPWSYLAPNYLAWARMEEAESLSRRENTQQAKETFQKALDQFSQAKESIKQNTKEITSLEETELTLRLLRDSELKCRFCQARIRIEEGKLLDRSGKYLLSSKSYEEAAQNILSLLEQVESEAERKELEYLAVLCQAWEKMAVAEETTSSESYLEAARLFEKAKEHCYTKKASLWTLGNSSFCKGLAAKTQFQNTFEKSFHSIANKHVKQAADYYQRAGFVTASEYAKATQRLFDACLYMNSAEEEVDPEKKTKYYQLTEQLLQIASGFFIKAKQPEKTAQVQGILATVREEKALAASLDEVMHAPSITSSTMTFTAPSPTSEVSVGLEQFQHANVQANLIAGLREVKVGESFCLTVEFVNAGKEPALLTRVEDFVPLGFVVVEKPEIYRLEESCLNMKGKQLPPLKLVEAKVVLQPSKKGLYRLSPRVHYLDELGQNRSLQLKSVEIRVEEVVLADRVSTGTRELDSLLLGGIPREYAVVLTGHPSDERELIVRNFLEAGTGEGQAGFYVATEAVGLEGLLEKAGFYLFLCNPKPKVEVPDLPNVYKLLGKTDLTNLGIALLKAYRNMEQSSGKRVCLDIVSDVLLRYGAEATRRWISELVTDMGSKGFTILAIMDPAMHPADQATAVLNLFDGEISLTQSQDPYECKKSLLIKRLRNQDYIKNPICLTKSAT